MSEKLSIKCENVVVSYSLYSLKVSTLKEFVLKKIKKEISSIDKIALAGVSIEAKKGECIALIGHNGCGKSTLLKCIAGILKPLSGSIYAEGRIAPMIELGAGFDPEMTGRENVYLSCSLLGLTKSEISEKIPEIERFAELGLFFDAPVKTYSSGMYMRLGFACTTAIQADIVLIDEILAVGDENFQRKCMEKIRSIRHSGSTVVLVSHELATVSKMADRVYVLNEGHLVFQGVPAEAIDFYHQLMDKKRFDSLTIDEQAEELRLKKLSEGHKNELFGKLARIRETSVAFIGQSGGESLSIQIEVELFQDFDNPVVVGFGLNTCKDQRIFGSNSRSVKGLGNLGPIRKGIYRLDFQYDKIPLASGEYYVTAAIHNHELDQTLDLQHRISDFHANHAEDAQNFDGDLIQPNALAAKLNITSLS